MLLTDVMTYLMKGTLTNIKGVLRGDGKTLGETGVDSTPIAGSENLITSGGVKSALDAQKKSFNVPANSSLSLNFSLYAQAIVFLIGYSTSATGAFLLSRASDSVLIQVPLASASAVTISMDSDGVVTITSTSSSTIYLYLTIGRGTITEVT